MWFFSKLFWGTDMQDSLKEEKKSLFNEWESGLKLIDAGKNKIAIIKEIREITWFGLKDAKWLADYNWIIKENISYDDAVKLRDKLTQMWAIVEVI